jgi:hypothetical protein
MKNYFFLRACLRLNLIKKIEEESYSPSEKHPISYDSKALHESARPFRE